MKRMTEQSATHVCGFFAFGFTYFGGYYFSTPERLPARR